MKQLFYMINFFWRVIATGLSFIVFCVGGLFLSFIICPVISMLSPNDKIKAQRTQYMISITFDCFIYFVQLSGLAKVNAKEIYKLREMKGCLIVSNHPTLIDYVIIVSKLRHCNTVVKEDIFKNFFFKRVVNAANYIPNTQSLETFESIKNSIQKGDNILIFPEGSRSVPGKPLTLRRGAANIALRASVPIQMIYIKTSESLLTKGNPWYKIPKKRAIYYLKNGERIEPKSFLKTGVVVSRAARHLTQHIKTQFEGEINLCKK
jgi:1-acyl-sn-glycerol-3-phosphate acyltransferase